MKILKNNLKKCECKEEDLTEDLVDEIKQIIKTKKSDTQAIQDISDIIEVSYSSSEDKPEKQDQRVRVDEALHDPFEIETFFKMAKDIGIDKLSDLEKFLKNEAEPGESEWETMLRYRASLGNDFKIDPKKNESVEKGEKCVICGKEIKEYGNNPAPVKDSGKCCDDCNKKIVIPARLKVTKNEEFKESDGAVEAKEDPQILPRFEDKKKKVDESLTEAVKKLPDGKYANVGKDGKADSGKFKTKKEADAQRKAMYANGYKGESLQECDKFKYDDSPYDYSEYHEYEEEKIDYDDDPTMNY